MNDNKELIEELKNLRVLGINGRTLRALDTAIDALRAAPSTPPAPHAVTVGDGQIASLEGQVETWRNSAGEIAKERDDLRAQLAASESRCTGLRGLLTNEQEALKRCCKSLTTPPPPSPDAKLGEDGRQLGWVANCSVELASRLGLHPAASYSIAKIITDYAEAAPTPAQTTKPCKDCGEELSLEPTSGAWVHRSGYLNCASKAAALPAPSVAPQKDAGDDTTARESKDSARLDWLDAQIGYSGRNKHPTDGLSWFSSGQIKGSGKTIREAIDTAMEGTK